jgi:hypothetical protein
VAFASQTVFGAILVHFSKRKIKRAFNLQTNHHKNELAVAIIALPYERFAFFQTDSTS